MSLKTPPTYLYIKDAAIVREVDEHSGLPTVHLYDCEGEMRYFFPPEWTDEQICHAIRFANKAFAAGYKLGDYTARYEIRAVLGIPHPAPEPE